MWSEMRKPYPFFLVRDGIFENGENVLNIHTKTELLPFDYFSRKEQ